MIDPDRHELEAMESALPFVAEYLGELGTWDLSKLNKEQMMTLVKIIYGNTTHKLAILVSESVDMGKL